MSFGGYVDRIILGSVLIVVLSFFPRGIAGAFRTMLTWRSRRTIKQETRP